MNYIALILIPRTYCFLVLVRQRQNILFESPCFILSGEGRMYYTYFVVLQINNFHSTNATIRWTSKSKTIASHEKIGNEDENTRESSGDEDDQNNEIIVNARESMFHKITLRR